MANGHGGFRPGAGRKHGQRNKASVERELRAQQGLAAAQTSGELPLDLLLRRMRGDTSITETQFQAAVAAAPFCHPRLTSTDATVRSDNTVRIVADEPMSVEQWEATFVSHANDSAAPERLADEVEAAD